MSGGAPTLDIRALGARDGFERGRTGTLTTPRISFAVEMDAVVLEHSLLGSPMRQRLPILPGGGPAREYLACRCGRKTMVLHLRYGEGFLCNDCAARFYGTPEIAAAYRARRLIAKLERRIGRTGRKPKRMTIETWSRLHDRLQLANREFQAALLGQPMVPPPRLPRLPRERLRG